MLQLLNVFYTYLDKMLGKFQAVNNSNCCMGTSGFIATARLTDDARFEGSSRAESFFVIYTLQEQREPGDTR